MEQPKIKWKNVAILGLTVLLVAFTTTLYKQRNERIEHLTAENEQLRIERSEEYREFLELQQKVNQMELVIEHQNIQIEDLQDQLGAN